MVLETIALPIELRMCTRGPGRDRTYDHLINNQELLPLSYQSMKSRYYKTSGSGPRGSDGHRTHRTDLAKICRQPRNMHPHKNKKPGFTGLCSSSLKPYYQPIPISPTKFAVLIILIVNQCFKIFLFKVLQSELESDYYA